MSNLKVFYDGACTVCYREMKHYMNKDSNNLLDFIDISSKLFDANEYGLNEEEIKIHIHTMNQDGKIFKGVDSFIEIWKRIPNHQPLASIFSNEKVRPFADMGYNIFANYIRPNLPKRKCEDNSCNLRVS